MNKMTPDILEKYFVNNMLLQFNKEEYFRNFGLLAELQIQDMKVKVRFCLTTGEAWKSGEINNILLSNVFEVISRLRTKTEKILMVYFYSCRIGSPLQKQLSKKTR